MKTICIVIQSYLVCACLSSFAAAQQPMENMAGHHMEMAMGHEHHGAGVPASYEELTKTVNLLAAARQATAKYHDVHAAETDGYKAIGPDVPGMGIHYVHVGAHSAGFNIEQPDILLYEKTDTAPGGYALVGVSYLFNAETDADGQPKNPPFPKSLASWHRHENICVLPDRSTPGGLSEDQCKARGGRFTAETQWMIHAWIWKDSPTGVFSATNPNVR
jgi:hypothetical protein